MPRRSAAFPLLAAALACACGPAQPAAIATGLTWPLRLASDATWIYWLQADGAVGKVSGNGGAPAQVAPAQVTLDTFEIPVVDGFSLAVDGEAAWFTTFNFKDGVRTGIVWKAPHGGSPAALANWPGEPAHVAVDAEGVYVVHNPYDATPGVLERLPREGGPATRLAEGPVWPCALAVDGASVYWLARGAHPGEAAGGELGSVAKAGGEPSVRASGLHRPVAMRIADGSVYWLDDGSRITAGAATVHYRDGAIGRLGATGGAELVVTGLATHPSGFAVLGASVFYIEWKPMEARRSGIAWETAPVSDAELGTGQVDLAADGSALYWATSGHGASILKLER